MDIGKRLRELREAKGFPQGDIERRTGLMRSYLSRVECGHTVPSIETPEKWAKALEVELSQVFYQREGKPALPRVVGRPRLHPKEKRLLSLHKRLPEEDKDLFRALIRITLKKAH